MSYGGSSGSGSIHGATDVALSNPSDGQVLTYSSSLSKWENAAAAAASGVPGEIALDSFSGSNDDALLAAAMNYASAQTYPPLIRLTNRSYSFSNSFTPYTGFRLAGPVSGISNSELSNNSMGCQVNVTTNGTWLNVSGGDVYDALISGITFIGSSSTTFLGCGDGTSIWHCSQIRDCSFHSFKTVLGTQAQKLLMTACLIDGWMQMQGCYNGGVHIGGSDNRLFMNGFLVDGSEAYNNAGSAAGQFHIWCDGLDNTALGAIYITAQQNWGGLRVTGSAYNAGGPPSNLGMVWCWGATIEGQSASNPCNGSLVRVEGGILKLRDAYVGRGMYNPSAMGHSPQDAGAIHVLGGMLLADGITYDRCTGVGESVPFVYLGSAGNARVSNTLIGSKGGTWSGQPQVHNAGSGTLVIDDSVTQV